MLTVIRPADALLTAAEGELYRCPAAPTLDQFAEGYDDVLAVALRLRAAYDGCLDLSGRLIGIATRVPGKAAGT